MKGACCVLVLAGCLLSLTAGFPRSRKTRNYLLGRHTTALLGGPVLTSAPHYCNTVKWYEQRLDHFNVAEERTFQQRYLVNDEKWDRQGPILLYTGNEGDIIWFCNNTVSILWCHTPPPRLPPPGSRSLDIACSMPDQQTSMWWGVRMIP